MARSSYIYVVYPTPDYDVDSAPIAAFTVKHELVRWLTRKDPKELENLSVTRLPDGGRTDPKPSLLDIDELLAA